MTATAAERPTADHDGDLWTSTATDTETAWHAGYTDGHAAGVDARTPADVWVPVELRWRHVRPADTFLGRGEDHWHVATTTPRRDGRTTITARHAAREHAVDVDPDDTITVLCPAPERDALTLTRDMLGARLLDRPEAPA